MGLTYIDGTVTGPTGRQANVRFLVDSGATYTLLAEADWRAIELTPTRSVTFTLADGTQLAARRVSECRLALPLGEAQLPLFSANAAMSHSSPSSRWRSLVSC